MGKWKRQTLKLKENHGWRAKPGYKIFVADRGAVRFDIPQEWIMDPGKDSIKFHDRTPPDDDCLLQVSVLHLSPGSTGAASLWRNCSRGRSRVTSGAWSPGRISSTRSGPTWSWSGLRPRSLTRPNSEKRVPASAWREARTSSRQSQWTSGRSTRSSSFQCGTRSCAPSYWESTSKTPPAERCSDCVQVAIVTETYDVRHWNGSDGGL